MKPLRLRAPAEVLAMALERHHIISASAGTGKTFAIEHRVVDLIVRGAAQIDEILVVTFTEKATAELRLRVRSKLESLVAARHSTATDEQSGWIFDGAGRRRVQEALLGFDRAPIFTIHGFCHRVISESGFSAGRALHPVAVPAEAAFASAFADLMRNELVTDEAISPLLRAWFGNSRTATDLRGHLYRCRERGGHLEPAFDRNSHDRALARAAAAVATDPLRGLDVHPNSARAIERWLAEVAPAIVRAASSDSVGQAIAELEVVRPTLRKLADKTSSSDLEIFAAAAQLGRSVLDLDAAMTVMLLPRLEDALATSKHLLGHIDFGDMLALVAAALEEERGSELASELRQRYPLALIDEFQDTSELQWRIFRSIYLCGPPGQPGDRARLTVVGDAKQAIYSFRGADLHTYRMACGELRAAGADELVLDTNYRSSPQLIEAINQITAADFGDPFFLETDADARVAAGRKLRLLDGDQDAAPVVVFELTGDKRRSNELSRELIRIYTAEVAHLLSPECRLELEFDGSRRPLTAGDIMLLTRSRADSNALADALARRGIASSTLHNQDLYATTEARELLDLLLGVANPRSPLRRARALSTRFFDLPLAAVARAAEDPDSVDALVKLHRWRQYAERRPLETVLPMILDESRLALRELALDRGSRTLTNIEHLLELLVADVVRSRCNLAELAERLEMNIEMAQENERSEATRVRLEGDADAVQIMTIHAAKGLEAAVVFVFGGYGKLSVSSERVHTYHADSDATSSSDDTATGSRRLHVGRLPVELAPQVEAERDAEDERLMYVAITRAAARLYAVRIEHSVFRVAGSYRVLNRRLDPFATEPVRSLVERRAARDALSPPLLTVVGEDAPSPVSSIDEPETPSFAAPIIEERAGVAVTSYSRIKRSGAIEDAAKLGIDQLGVDGSLGRLGGREVGILTHWILERIELAPVSAIDSAAQLSEVPEAASLIDRAMRAFALEPSYRETLNNMVFAGLTTPLTVGTGDSTRSLECFRDITCEAREVEFTFPVNRGESLRGFVTGFLDVVLESEGKVYVVDWKSDALASYAPEAIAEHVENAYKTQLELYSLALEQIIGLLGESKESSETSDRFGGVIYCFLRGASCYGVTASPEQLVGFRNALLETEEHWRI